MGAMCDNSLWGLVNNPGWPTTSTSPDSTSLESDSWPTAKSKITTHKVVMRFFKRQCNFRLALMYFKIWFLIPMDQNWVQFCRSNHLRGQCYSNWLCKAWHSPLTAAKIAQLNIFLRPYVATYTNSGPAAPSNMWCVGPEVDNDTRDRKSVV